MPFCNSVELIAGIWPCCNMLKFICSANSVVKDTIQVVVQYSSQTIGGQKHGFTMLVAVQYGSQTVPITDDLERLLAFKPAKGMQLLGFVTNDPAAPLVPRHTFMSVRRQRGTLTETSLLSQRRLCSAGVWQGHLWPQPRRRAGRDVQEGSQHVFFLAPARRTGQSC